MKKTLISLLAILTLIFTSDILYAEKGRKERKGFRDRPHHKGKRHHKGKFFGNPEVMKKKLDLTDVQVEKIGALNLEYKREFLKIREKLAPKGIKLESMLLEDNVNIAKVRSILKEIADLKVEIQILRIKQKLDIEKILTPGQRTKLKNSRMGRDHMGPPHRDMEPPPPYDRP